MRERDWELERELRFEAEDRMRDQESEARAVADFWEAYHGEDMDVFEAA